MEKLHGRWEVLQTLAASIWSILERAMVFTGIAYGMGALMEPQDLEALGLRQPNRQTK